MASYIGQNVCGPVGLKPAFAMAGSIKIARSVLPSPLI